MWPMLMYFFLFVRSFDPISPDTGDAQKYHSESPNRTAISLGIIRSAHLIMKMLWKHKLHDRRAAAPAPSRRRV